MNTLIHYNAHTPEGRAIEHVLDKSALADLPVEVRELPDGGRSVVIARIRDLLSDGEGSLISFCESLSGHGQINLWLLLGVIDERSKRAVAEAIFIAGGFRGATYVQVPA